MTKPHLPKPHLVVIGNGMARRCREAFADAPGIGGRFSATGSPVQAQVKALTADFRIRERLVFREGNARKSYGADED